MDARNKYLHHNNLLYCEGVYLIVKGVFPICVTTLSETSANILNRLHNTDCSGAGSRPFSSDGHCHETVLQCNYLSFV